MFFRFAVAVSAFIMLAGSALAAPQPPKEASALIPRESFLRQVDSHMDGLVHLKVTGSGVRLRKGPGTSHGTAGIANENGEGWHAELIASKEKVSGEGRQWYHVLYVVEKEVTTAYVRTDAWICADFVKASGLVPDVRAEIASEHFGIMDFKFFEIETVDSQPVSVPSHCLTVPAFSFKEPVVLESNAEDAVNAVTVPSGTLLALCDTPPQGGRPSFSRIVRAARRHPQPRAWFFGC